jgi:hypothetical protein
MPELGIGLGIHKGGVPKKSLLLDKYDMDAAFSLRKVRADYNGPCVRVRNSSGEFADIGFTSKGVLDEAALNAHCGANDGTVQTWYNQSTEGGRYNAVQDTVADQPIIYDASAGGYLGYVENTGDMYLRFENQLAGVTNAAVVYENTTAPASFSGSAYVVGEHEVSAAGGNGILVGHNSVNGFSFVPDSGTNIQTNTGEGQNEKHAGFIYTGGSDKFAVVDGYVCGESSDAGSANFDYIFTKAKNDGGQDSFDFVGKVWEVFLSTSDLSAKRIALENSILSANGLTVPDLTMLEKYDGAEGAFSTRCINREHVGPIMEVRGAQTTAVVEDVYLDSTGVVNKSRITELCTDDEDSNALVNGYVKTWYDQSSFGYDVTNTTDAQQPVIHDATNGVVLLNGQPAVEFDGSDDILESSSQTINTEAIIAVASTNNEATNAQHIIRQGTAYIRFDAINHVEYRNNVNLRDDSANNTPGLVNDNAALVSWYTKGTSFHDANASWKWYFNGDLLGTQTGNNLSSESGPIKIGAQTAASERLNGKVCEAIIIDKRDAHYDSADQIHQDINAHYLIYQEATASPTSGFLADYSGAAAAYSVRQLGDANLCMRVRRDGDDAERNIGFGSDGFVDTSAISDFCGTDNGFVVTWFDQSGNAIDATQGTPAEQPKIYDGTDGVIKDNGYPATEWSAASGQSLETTYTTDSSEFTVVAVANGDDSASNKTIVLTPEALVFLGSDELAKHIQGSAAQTGYSSADFNDQAIHFVGNSGSESFAGENGDTLTTLSESTSTNSLLRIGNNANESIPFLGTIQEIVYYISDQSSSRTAIEENVNDAFNVHPDADTTPESGFLNEFSGAAAAYSVRKLGDSPVAMRVRKTVSAVDYYQIIGFDANGDLDTAAIEEFGGSNDVFVQTWYDQSGNGNHASNSTNAEQPKIYDGTDGIEKENGIPTIQFDGTDDYLKADGYIVELSQNSASVFVTANGGTPDVNTDYLLSEGDLSDPYSSNFIFGGGTSAGSAPVLWVNGTTFGTITTGQHVIGFDYDGTNFQAHLDGSTAGSSGTAIVNSEASGGGTHIGTRADGTTAFYNGNAQEIITYKSDKSSDRSDIESNINNYFLVHQEASASPATGLLSEAPNAAAAYSVRQLGDAKLCMKVRRGSDNATKNIGFVGGVVNTAAIEAFCGNSDGTVDTWYDQSGSGNHAIQGTAGSQPKIYDSATGVVTENGKPALELDGVDDGLSLSSVIAASSQKYTFTTHAVDSSDAAWSIFYEAAATYVVPIAENGSTTPISFGYTLSDAFRDGTSLVSDINRTGLYDTYSPAGQSLTTLDFSGDGIGGFFNRINFFYTGTAQEILIYDSDKSSSRSDIETNINNHFKVYTPFTTGLLDSYPGASAAYSLRRLSSTYTGPAIEVTSNSSTQDIGFDTEGNLDTSALAAFCGSNDGTVSKWYDQSGNGNDLVQSTANDQPKVYDGTDGLVKISDQPAVEFYESNGKFLESSSNITVDDFFVLNVIEKSIHAGSDCLWGFGTSGDTEFQYLANLNNGEDYYIRRDNGSGTNVNSYVGRQLDFEGPHNVVSLSYDQTNPVLRINGKVEWDADASGVYGADDQRIVLGNTPQENSPYRGKQQEFLIYPSDMRTKVAGIEKNINNHYSIYEQPLLDVVPDAAAAYSLRKLRADYTGPAINVYNGTDYKDIYFRRDGSLDTTAITKFCGSNDGTVAIWYDQSGNANHAEQTTLASRPKIYDGTSGILTEGDKPILSFAASNRFNLSSNLSILNENFFYVTAETVDLTVYGLVDDTDYLRNQVTRYLLNDGGTLYASNISPSSGYSVHSVINDNGAYQNGTRLADFTNALTISADSILEANAAGSYQELVIYDSDQSNNRTTVEGNINHYYGIY